ncbi:MAG: hypothetical protein ACXABV_18635 [Candidatus Thorarchaeota archaeon]|jgi:hypothetical protein
MQYTFTGVFVSNYWEEREKSWGYYLCLALLIGYVCMGIFAYMSWWTSFQGFVLAVLYTLILIVSRFGLGVRYGYRGINPATRNMMTTADRLYIDPDEL